MTGPDITCLACKRPTTAGAGDCPTPWAHIDGAPRAPLPPALAPVLVCCAGLLLGCVLLVAIDVVANLVWR